MLGRRPLRALWTASLSLSLACGASAPAPEDDAARLEARARVVEAAACLRPASRRGCEPGLAATFEGAAAGAPGRRVAGAIACEGGRPRARLSLGRGEVTGEVGQVVWEAIWRALDASGSCALAFGAPVSVTQDGRARPCAGPRFDLSELFTRAHVHARRGPPTDDRDAPICEIEPDACFPPRPACPPFRGDEWSGVRAKRGDD